ncbi:MAG: EscU/YscU/HrcU family type III secretion system export apparatus switch protein [Deltaproteobacteria bacterium]|nr:EscU/YscU/HrcU family type III secretion system export apparatus switch protein [Deltaproteobacteria bacterium]
MSGGDYPPSESRLSELRSEGIVPTSRDLTFAGALCGMVVAFLVLLPEIPAFREAALRALTLQPETREGAAPVLLMIALRSGIMIAGCAALGALGAGLLQTRFLFRYPREFRARGTTFPAEATIVSRLATEVLGVGKCLVAALVIGLTALSGTRQYFDSLAFGGVVSGGDVALGWNAALVSLVRGVHSVWLAVVVVTVTLGAASFLVSRARFRYEQRMSRAELEAEIRELQANPAMRQAIKETASRDDQARE